MRDKEISEMRNERKIESVRVQEVRKEEEEKYEKRVELIKKIHEE